MMHLNDYRRWGTLLLLTALACGSEFDRFTIVEQSSTTVPGNPLGGLLGVLGFDGFVSMDISDNQELQNQGVEKHQIDSVHIQTVVLTITDTSSGQNFNFIDDLSFFVESAGLPRVLVASGSDFESGATQIGLTVEDVDLAAYATAESMDITTEASGSAPGNDTTIDARIELLVDVNIDGAICGG